MTSGGLKPALWLLVAILTAACCVAPAGAQNLRIGVRAAIDSDDPANGFGPDRNIWMQVYESLLLQDEKLKPVPGLAISWTSRDPTTWAFKLRPGVLFHDGSPLTPADVLFTIKRDLAADFLQNFKPTLRAIESIDIEGADTIVIHTHAPSPGLPYDMATFGIVSARAAAGATAEDFNGGRAAVGTGPFRWIKWTPGQGVVMERNDHYWGAAPPWARVQFNFIDNESARVAGLLAGDLDVAEAIPPELLDRVRNGPTTRVVSAGGILMMLLQPDIGRAQTPYAVDAEGHVLARNPLQDLRVRHAISMAINRRGLAERVMQGAVDPSGQMMGPGLDGHIDDLQPMKFDPAGARMLLAEAGYPQGFGLTITCSNDRYEGDARICQSLGQMLTAVGIHTHVETIPMTILLRRRTGGGPDGKMDLSLYMVAYGAPDGLATAALSSMAETQNRAIGRGNNNFSGYSNPVLDRLIQDAEREMDYGKRAGLVEQATRLAIEEAPVIPLLFTRAYWGLRRDLTISPRADSNTLAATVQTIH